MKVPATSNLSAGIGEGEVEEDDVDATVRETLDAARQPIHPVQLEGARPADVGKHLLDQTRIARVILDQQDADGFQIVLVRHLNPYSFGSLTI